MAEGHRLLPTQALLVAVPALGTVGYRIIESAPWAITKLAERCRGA